VTGGGSRAVLRTAAKRWIGSGKGPPPTSIRVDAFRRTSDGLEIRPTVVVRRKSGNHCRGLTVPRSRHWQKSFHAFVKRFVFVAISPLRLGLSAGGCVCVVYVKRSTWRGLVPAGSAGRPPPPEPPVARHGLDENSFKEFIGQALLANPDFAAFDAFVSQPRFFGEMAEWLKARGVFADQSQEDRKRHLQTLVSG
jgi:hypothetical protein